MHTVAWLLALACLAIFYLLMWAMAGTIAGKLVPYRAGEPVERGYARNFISLFIQYGTLLGTVFGTYYALTGGWPKL